VQRGNAAQQPPATRNTERNWLKTGAYPLRGLLLRTGGQPG
jgi:hypothetical protein